MAKWIFGLGFGGAFVEGEGFLGASDELEAACLVVDGGELYIGLGGVALGDAEEGEGGGVVFSGEGEGSDAVGGVAGEAAAGVDADDVAVFFFCSGDVSEIEEAFGEAVADFFGVDALGVGAEVAAVLAGGEVVLLLGVEKICVGEEVSFGAFGELDLGLFWLGGRGDGLGFEDGLGAGDYFGGDGLGDGDGGLLGVGERRGEERDGEERVFYRGRHALGLWASGGEGDVPDIGFGTDVEDADDVFEIGLLVASEDDGDVGIEFGDGGEALEECGVVDDGALEEDGSISADVDDLFVGGAVGSFSGFCGGDGDVELGLEAGEAPGDDEEDEEEEDDVDHRRQGHAGVGGRCGVAEFHGQRGKGERGAAG